MHCIAPKFLPHVLVENQKQNCVEVSQELVEYLNADENFLKNIITGDET
jgi:hypothetical protein